MFINLALLRSTLLLQTIRERYGSGVVSPFFVYVKPFHALQNRRLFLNLILTYPELLIRPIHPVLEQSVFLPENNAGVIYYMYCNWLNNYSQHDYHLHYGALHDLHENHLCLVVCRKYDNANLF